MTEEDKQDWYTTICNCTARIQLVTRSDQNSTKNYYLRIIAEGFCIMFIKLITPLPKENVTMVLTNMRSAQSRLVRAHTVFKFSLLTAISRKTTETERITIRNDCQCHLGLEVTPAIKIFLNKIDNVSLPQIQAALQNDVTWKLWLELSEDITFFQKKLGLLLNPSVNVPKALHRSDALGSHNLKRLIEALEEDSKKRNRTN